VEEHAPRQVYRISTRAEWADAVAAGTLTPKRFADEGFVHLSMASQILRPANLLYRGQDDLILLVIRVADLDGELIFEPGSHGEEDDFPHLYGPLNTNAVIATIDFPCRDDGSFELPEGLGA